MICLFTNARHYHTHDSVLLDLLDASVLPLGTPTETSSIEVKYAELVMKCIWKMTKNLQPCVANNRISLPELLLDLHKFLTATPPSEWRRRALAKLPLGDMPLRTVKTVLHELVMTNGSQLLTMLQQVVSDPKRSPVWQYLVAMLEHAGMLVDSEDHVSKIAATPATPAPTAPMEVDGSAMSNSASPVRQDALSPTVSAGIPMAKALCEREAVLALDQIFGRISSKEETKQVYPCAVFSFP